MLQVEKMNADKKSTRLNITKTIDIKHSQAPDPRPPGMCPFFSCRRLEESTQWASERYQGASCLGYAFDLFLKMTKASNLTNRSATRSLKTTGCRRLAPLHFDPKYVSICTLF